MTPTDIEELIERLENLGACVPGCEGRCTFCPDEVGREAATVLRTMQEEIATLRCGYDEAEKATAERDAMQKENNRQAELIVIAQERIRELEKERGKLQSDLRAEMYYRDKAVTALEAFVLTK